MNWQATLIQERGVQNVCCAKALFDFAFFIFELLEQSSIMHSSAHTFYCDLLYPTLLLAIFNVTSFTLGFVRAIRR